ASVWEGRARWNAAETQQHNTLDARVRAATPPPPAAAPKPEAPAAANYVDVAANNLFSKDRNPAIVIEAPKIEKPKQMPPLPVVYGVLGLPSGLKALMAEKAGASSRPVKAGDRVGEFQIAALDPQNVTFVWEGQEIQRKIEDLLDRSNHDPAGGPPAGGQPGVPAANVPPPPPAAAVTGSAALGVEVGTPGHSERTCRPGDNSPAGTVIDGYKKVEIQMPFGVNCRWIPVQ
ncbi:MAG TPA: hypothetical protein VEF06_01615, partial [Bryobacteraceae bacterium]|nr:hypothetical protein [Bryobacteraceae bacterium]